MKWVKFSDKLPVLGTNILIAHENDKLIGITEFTLEIRKAMLKDDGEYIPQLYYSDDPSEDCEYDIRISDYWAYPSSIRLPKKTKEE